jgi:hypothetical protein
VIARSYARLLSGLLTESSTRALSLLMWSEVGCETGAGSVSKFNYSL